ncbi:DMT family transporter [Oceanobacillus halotolerans]|uniref:DMT family transporter n=1 Tax=Oceanobacillus halotolerans TaxID=2663380 RepID=UPI0013DAF62E|nr:SMR family transporter [Oceanobacillus halotolerans]
MGWIYVFLAAVVEVFWVIGLKYADSWLEWIGTIISIVFSFYLVIKACEHIPSGTVYAVFTGLGAASIVLLDFLIFDASFSIAKLVFISLIIIGVIGIKITTKEVVSHKSKEEV